MRYARWNVMKGRVSFDEIDALKPFQNYPKHVIVGLCAKTESVLAKIKRGDLSEITVDGVLVLLVFLRVGVRRSSAGAMPPRFCHGSQSCRDLSTHDSGSPIDSMWPLTLPDCIEV